jgi:hypothetical protein
MLAVQNQYSNYNLVSLKRLIGLADGELWISWTSLCAGGGEGEEEGWMYNKVEMNCPGYVFSEYCKNIVMTITETAVKRWL